MHIRGWSDFRGLVTESFRTPSRSTRRTLSARKTESAPSSLVTRVKSTSTTFNRLVRFFVSVCNMSCKSFAREFPGREFIYFVRMIGVWNISFFTVSLLVIVQLSCFSERCVVIFSAFLVRFESGTYMERYRLGQPRSNLRHGGWGKRSCIIVTFHFVRVR